MAATANPDVERALSLLRRKRALLERRKAVKELGEIELYTPHRKQDLFHRAARYRDRYLRTGNRFGKSECGTAEDVAFALGYRPWMAKDDPDRTAGIPQRPTKGLIICVTWAKADEIFTSMEDGASKGKLIKYIPPDRLVKLERNSLGSVAKIIVRGKFGLSTITLATVQSYMNNQLSFESSQWDYIHVDEPCPEAMFKAVSRGLMDTDGSCWFTCTPLTEWWINDRFIPKGTQDKERDEPLIMERRWMLTGSIYDNPKISQEAIEAYEADLTEAEKACRLRGIPLQHSGRIYTFEHDRHLYTKAPRGWNNPYDPPKSYTIRYAIDPHPKTPTAVLFTATAPTGQVFFFRELFMDPAEVGQVSQMAEKIKEVINGRYVAQSICDPLGFIESPTDGKSMADHYWENGVFVEKAPKALQAGIILAQEALGKDDYLYFHESLVRTKWEFERYIWNPKIPDKPVDKDDHMMECFYRLVYIGLGYVEQTPDDQVFVPQVAV